MGHDRKGPAIDPRQGEARKPTTSAYFATGILGQIGFILAVILGVAALIFVAGSLGDENAGGLRNVAIGILVAVALGGIYLLARRRRGRQSLDEALRGRRSTE